MNGINQPEGTSSNTPKTSGMAVSGLVMGILSVTIGLCCGGPLFALLGIIFSAIGLSQINKNTTLYTGKGMALTGLILSILGLILTILVIILIGATGLLEELRKHRF